MGSYIGKEGETQFTLDLGVNNGLDGRNLQQEEANAAMAKKIKKQAPKNPNRIAGGKKAHQTKLNNKKIEFENRPLFKALNYTPEALISLKGAVSESCFNDIINKIEDVLNKR